MYVKSIKINKNLIMKILLGIFVLIAAAMLWATYSNSDDARITSSDSNNSSEKISYDKIKTNEDRVNFIRSFGWEVEEAAVEVMEVVIPKEFDSVYTSYNELQKEQGLDLQEHAGERAKRWSYVVINYGEGQENSEIRANLLIIDDEIVACDITKNELDGFMHGMTKPS